MGIPRKKSRKVEVHGRAYLYLVKEVNIAGHRDQFELRVTVQEDAEEPGRVMQFTWPYGCEVGPALVASMINTAIVQGWDPTERGGAFVLKQEEECGNSPFDRPAGGLVPVTEDDMKFLRNN